MSARQTAAGSLLARKGRAAPTPLAGSAGMSPPPRGQSEGGAEAAVETTQAAPAARPVSEAESAQRSEPAPPARLSPLDFRGGPGSRFDPERLIEDEDAGTRAPALALGVPSRADAQAEAEPTSSAARVPRADPQWRIGRDRSAGRRPRPGMGPAFAAGIAVALALGLGWQLQQAGWFSQVEDERRLAAPGGSGGPIPERPTEPQGRPAGPAPGGEPSAAGPAEAGAPPSTVEPSVDVVRIEPDGAAVIAGRAAPGAELIVLDNGAPIGTATADAFGEWVFIPSAPLAHGGHEFGLVVKSVQGGVKVPAAGTDGTADQPEAGAQPAGPERRSEVRTPLPPRKPPLVRGSADALGRNGTAVAAGSDFAVQLASVKTRAGAEQEWLALRRRFPALLAGLKLSLDEAKLAGGDRAIRLRTGPFDGFSAAAALCARLEARRQDCLVVRTSAGR